MQIIISSPVKLQVVVYINGVIAYGWPEANNGCKLSQAAHYFYQFTEE